jgi:uncharacterized protein (TIRG00374 family)
MSGGRVRATVLGFAGAVVVFALLFYLVGVDDLLGELARANRRVVAVVCLTVLGWLAAWSVSLHTVLSVLGVPISRVRAFLLFAGATFSNNVTPFGQAGGEPVTALLISQVTDAEYETGLAAIASVDTLNFIPSITLALIGVGYYATEFALGRNVATVIAAVVVLAVGVPTLVYAGWQRRYRLESRVIDALTPVVRRIAHVAPRVSPPSAAAIERRITGFFTAIERVATDRRNVAVALGFSALGWLLQVVALFLAFEAIGSHVSFALALFVVPIGAIAGVTPLPGGAGGIESVLVFLLVAATGPAVGTSTAAAAVVIYRGAVYWIPVVLGGAVTGVVSVRGRV